MIGYVTIGVSIMETAKEFYCGLFADKGAKVIIDSGRIAFIGAKRGEPMLALCEPYDKAIALGAKDDGGPGQRIEDRFYGAYVRDADNNKLCFYVFG